MVYEVVAHREDDREHNERGEKIDIREYEECEGVMCKSAATLYMICYFPYLLHHYFQQGINN